MSSYGTGANCDKLWRAWYFILIVILHLFFIYVGITRYLSLKSQAFDPKFGGDWDPAGLNFTLAMLIGAITFFFLFLFISLTRTSNYANEGVQVGRDTNNLTLLASQQPWRSGYQLLNLNSNAVYMHGNTVGENPIKRPEFATLAMGIEDDHMSVAGADDALPVGNFDTWSGRSGTNQEPLHSYPLGNTHRCLQQEVATHMTMRRSLILLWQRFKRHFLPYAVILHLAAAYCLILPIPIVHAQQIYHRALTADWIWRSDLDVLFGSSWLNRALEQTAGVSELTMENRAASSTKHSVHEVEQSNWDNLRAISPEFFNLALVFLLLSLRYPSVFWYTNRTFSFIFSLMLLLTGIHALLDHCASSILVKLAWNRETAPQLVVFKLITTPGYTREQKEYKTTSETATESAGSIKINVITNIGPLLLSTSSTMLFSLLFFAVFEYGYRQFTENLAAYRHFLSGSPNPAVYPDAYIPWTDPSDRKLSFTPNGFNMTHNRSDSIHSGPISAGKTPNTCIGNNVPFRNKSTHSLGSELLHPATRFCLHTYAPHIGALGGAVLVLGLKIPVMWDCIQVYRLSKHTLMLVAPLSGIVVMCIWFIVWFAFSLKPAWKFQVHLPLQTVPNVPLPACSDLMHAFQPNVGSVVNGPMFGSVTRPSSLGVYRGEINGRITTGVLASNSAALTPETGLLSSQSRGFPPDEGLVSQSALSGSPIYACFHDPVSGYLGASARLIRPANGTESELMGGASADILPVQRSSEHCSEEMEASSGRQSRNNYVCLQTAFGSATNGPNTPGVTAMPVETAMLLARMAPCTLTPQPSRSQGQSTSFVSSAPRKDSGGQMMSSPSSGRDVADEDASSTNTVQLSNFRFNTLQISPVYPGHTLGPYSALSVNRYFQNQQALGTLDNRDCLHPSSTSRIEEVPSSTSCPCDGDLISRNPLTETNIDIFNSKMFNSRVSHGPINSSDPNTIIPRVTFKEDVDVISTVSPLLSNNGSPNDSSNGNNFEKFKSPCIPTSVPSDSSGTYDNAFSNTFRSSIVIREPRQTIDRGVVGEGAGTLQRTSVSSHITNQPMNGSIHVTSQPMFESTHGQVQQSSSELSSFGTITTAGRLNRMPEMIGDCNNSFQSSSTEQFPALHSTCVITNDANEPRLCSQV